MPISDRSRLSNSRTHHIKLWLIIQFSKTVTPSVWTSLPATSADEVRRVLHIRTETVNVFCCCLKTFFLGDHLGSVPSMNLHPRLPRHPSARI